MKITNKYYIAIFLLFLTAIGTSILLPVGSAYKKRICKLICIASAQDTTYCIHPFFSDDGLVVVLPSGWEINNLVINCKSSDLDGNVDEDEEEVPAEEESPDYSSNWSPWNVTLNQNNKIILKGFLGFSQKLDIKVVQSKIKAIMINTKSGNMDRVDNSEDKSKKERGWIKALNHEGLVLYDGELESIKGHGNSTWQNEEKKSYNIKLTERAPLCSIANEKSFSLISNSSDVTGLYNYLAYKLCDMVEMPYRIDYSYTTLYLNGNYQGLYLICNKIKQGRDNLNIADLEKSTQNENAKKLKLFKTSKYDSKRNCVDSNTNDFSVFLSGIKNANNPEDITGGYIIESFSRLGNNVGSFVSNHNIRKSIRYPKYPTIEQTEYIKNRYNEVENFITDGYVSQVIADDSISKLIDLNSFAKYYLIQEFLLNRDMELASFFLYKDIDSIDTKFYAGPIWDMDGLRRGDIYNIPYGYAMRSGIISPINSLSASFRSSNSKGIFYGLFEHFNFEDYVKIVYEDVFRKAIKQWLEKEIYDLQKMIEDDWNFNSLVWRNPQNINYYISDIKSFYSKRYSFFERDMILKNNDYCKIVVDAPEFENYAYHLLEFHVKRGERLEIPLLNINIIVNKNDTIKLSR